MLGDLAKALPRLELEDWNLDKSVEFSSSDSSGRRNRMRAGLLACTLDALMVHTMSIPSQQGDTSEQGGASPSLAATQSSMVALLRLRCQLEEMVEQGLNKERPSKSKRRLVLPVSQLDAAQSDDLLTFWFRFFNPGPASGHGTHESTTQGVADSSGNNTTGPDGAGGSSGFEGMEGSDEECVAAARYDESLQRWLLGACLDRFADLRGDPKASQRLAMHLAPFLLTNFERLRTTAMPGLVMRPKKAGGKGSKKGAGSGGGRRSKEGLTDLSLQCLCVAIDAFLTNPASSATLCVARKFLCSLFPSSAIAGMDDAAEDDVRELCVL